MDVAKDRLDVAVGPSGETWSAANDEAGITALVARLRPLGPALILCEATGGFECAAIAAGRRGLPVVVANPRQVRRKRYGCHDSRGRLAGKRAITARPAAAAARTQVGHWEGDTMLGAGQAGPCVLSLVERKTGYVVLGKAAAAHQHPRGPSRPPTDSRPAPPVRTITVDNGTEFHECAALERATATRFYFATLHHAWERARTRTPTACSASMCPKVGAWPG